MRALAVVLLFVLSRSTGAATFLSEIQTGPIWAMPPKVTPDGLFAYADLGAFQRAPDGTLTLVPVSYTHLTLPTNREV